MAGSLSLSLSQQFDSQARPLSGGKLYFFQTGTSTPQNAFQDTALTIAHPNPLTLDSSGRIPAFYLADGTIKIRLNDINGIPVFAYDGLLVIGPSSGAGASPSVDATTVLATGDIKARYGTAAILTGFVRLNGRTIGGATSGASELANASAQPLFELLWNADPNLNVSGGRGGTSTADFTANKTITLPDFRGRVPAGLDDMGNAAAGRLTSSFFGTNATVLGAAGGAESQTLDATQIPVHTHIFAGDALPPHGHTVNNGTSGLETNQSGSLTRLASNDSTAITVSSVSAGTPTGTNSSIGGGLPHNIAQPTILVTYYIKL
jgi:microcystin-dependent protein